MARQRLTVDIVTDKRNRSISSSHKSGTMTDDDCHFYDSNEYEERSENLKYSNRILRKRSYCEGDNSDNTTDESTVPLSSLSSSSSSYSESSNDEELTQQSKFDGSASLTLEEVFTIGGNSSDAVKQYDKDRSRSRNPTESGSTVSRSKVRFRPGKGFAQVRPVNCSYTPKELVALWFTQEEYNSFLKDCDEEAQKCEARIKAKRMARIKKRIRMENSQRKNASDGKSKEIDEKGDDILCSDDDESNTDVSIINEDSENIPPCPLGLEAWTLEGYKTRQRRRKTAIDAVLDEQFAAWDKGEQEHPEVMATLYFAATVTSKRAATSKALKLQAHVRKYLLESTLKDYGEAVRALTLLQQSLHCIKECSQNEKNPTNTTSRGKNFISLPSQAESDPSPTSVIIDRAISITEEQNDISHDWIPHNEPVTNSSKSSGSRTSTAQLFSPKSASSPLCNIRTSSNIGDSVSRKPANSSNELKMERNKCPSTPSKKTYKSKAALNLLDSPPSPPPSDRMVVKSSSGRRKPESLRSLDLSVKSEKSKKKKEKQIESSESTSKRISSKSPHRSRQTLSESNVMMSPRAQRRGSSSGSTTSVSSSASKSPRRRSLTTTNGREPTRSKSPRPTRRHVGDDTISLNSISNSIKSPRPSKRQVDGISRGKSPRTSRRMTQNGSSAVSSHGGSKSPKKVRETSSRAMTTPLKVAKKLIEKTSSHSSKRDTGTKRK